MELDAAAYNFSRMSRCCDGGSTIMQIIVNIAKCGKQVLQVVDIFSDLWMEKIGE